MRRKHLITLTFCILLLFVVKTPAQQPTGNLSGNVTDEDDVLYPNSTVTIKLKESTSETKANGFIRTTQTGELGAYKFENIPPGVYEVTAEFFLSQFLATYKNKNVRVAANQITKLDIQTSDGAECENSEAKSIILNDADRIKILNHILEDYLSNENHSLVKENSVIYLSDKNIKAEWIKPFKTTKFNIINVPKTRESFQDRSDIYPYLSFDKFTTKGDCVVIILSENHYGSGYVTVYLYDKESGKITSKRGTMWSE